MTQCRGWLRAWQRRVRWCGAVVMLCATMPVFAQDAGRPPARPVSSSPVPAASPTAGASITLRGDRLSLDLRNQEFHTVLRSIAQQGAIDIRHLEGVPNTPLSLSFTALPVVTGLQRLLRAAAVQSYVLVTTAERDRVRVKRILFFADASPSRTGRVARERIRPTRRPIASPPARSSAAAPEEQETSDSVFDDIKTNTAARRLLSQLVHPNEQVRDRALERLVRLIEDDDKQVELLEFLEPLLEDLGSDERQAREEARQEIRKLLRR